MTLFSIGAVKALKKQAGIEKNSVGEAPVVLVAASASRAMKQRSLRVSSLMVDVVCNKDFGAAAVVACKLTV